jgi:hypothetical protein
MAWEIGNQKSRSEDQDFNKKLFEMKGLFRRKGS